MLSRSVKIPCLQTELAAVVMEDFIHFLQAVVNKICFLDFIMNKKCCGNDVAAFAKLSHVTYVRTASDGNMSVVALSLEKGFFDVATY